MSSILTTVDNAESEKFDNLSGRAFGGLWLPLIKWYIVLCWSPTARPWTLLVWYTNVLLRSSSSSTWTALCTIYSVWFGYGKDHRTSSCNRIPRRDGSASLRSCFLLIVSHSYVLREARLQPSSASFISVYCVAIGLAFSVKCQTTYFSKWTLCCTCQDQASGNMFKDIAGLSPL